MKLSRLFFATTLLVTPLLAQPTTTPAEYPFIKDIERFEAADAKKMPEPNGLLFVGSSTIVKWKAREAFAELPVIDRGFGGSQMVHALHFVKRVVTNYQPKAIVLYEGDNDLAAGKTPVEIADQFAEFEQVVLQETKATLLIILPKRSIARAALAAKYDELNAMLIAQANSSGGRIRYVDFGPLLYGADGKPDPINFEQDGLHLSRAGYDKWNEAIRPTLVELMKD